MINKYYTIMCNDVRFDSLEDKVSFKVVDEALAPSEEVIGEFYCFIGNIEEFYYSHNDSLFQPLNAKEEHILDRLENCYKEAKLKKMF